MRTLNRLSVFVLLCGALGACGHDSIPVGDPNIDPNAPDELLFQEGLAAYNAVDYDVAIAKFDELLATYPDSPRHDNSGYLVGRSYYSQRLYPDSLNAMSEMLAVHANSTFSGSALYFRGRSRFKLAGLATPEDTYPAALTDFEESVTVDAIGTYADNATYYIGRTHYQDGNFTQALASLAEVEAMYPDSSYIDNARYYVGRTHFELGQFSEAVTAYDLVLEDTASSLRDNARYRRGRANYAIPDYAEALLDLEDVESSFAGSIFEDNALYYRVRVHVDQAACAEASTVLSNLQSNFAGSSYIGFSQNYMSGNGC